MNQSILFSFTKPKEIKLPVIIDRGKTDMNYTEVVEVKNKAIQKHQAHIKISIDYAPKKL